MRDFIDSRVVGGRQQIKTRDHVPHRRRAGPVAVRLHHDRRAVRHDRRRPRRARRARQADGRARTATRPSSRATCTSPTATRSTGRTARTGSSRTRSRCIPRHARSSSTARFYPPDEVIAPRDRPQPRRPSSSSSSRPAARTRRSARRTTALRAVLRRLRERRRAGARTRSAPTPPPAAPGSGPTPQTTTLPVRHASPSGSRGAGHRRYKAGAGAESYDVDGGVTTIRSTPIALAGDGRHADLPLLPRPRLELVEPDSFEAYVEDEGGDRTLVREERGAANTDKPVVGVGQRPDDAVGRPDGPDRVPGRGPGSVEHGRGRGRRRAGDAALGRGRAAGLVRRGAGPRESSVAAPRVGAGARR